MSRQSKKMSLVEAITNNVVGYAISMVIQSFLLHALFNIRISTAENFFIVGIFTIASIVRSFIIRVIFEEIRVRTSR